ETAKVLADIGRDRHESARWEDAARDDIREQQDENDAKEEARERDAHEGDARGQQIDDRVALDGGQDADDESEGDRDRERGEAELKGRRQPFDDRFRDLLLVLER